MSKIKDNFIRSLIDELNDINERERVYYDKNPIDVCYIVSVIDQQLENCKEFMDVIENKKWLINGYDEDSSGGYTNGRIRILIEKPDEEKESEYMVDAYENYCYYIEFRYDERPWGYCECNSDYEGYNPKYNCCGTGCDWVAPAFKITKEIDMYYGSWNGYEKDYWEYKEKFEQNEENKNAEVEKYKKEQTKEFLLKQIKELQNKLVKLDE